MKVSLLVLLFALPLQDSDEVTQLLKKVGSDSIEERDGASKRLSDLGFAVRDRVLAAESGAPAEVRVRLEKILEAIERQPASLLPLIDLILKDPETSIHQKVVKANDRVRAALIGQSWDAVRGVIDSHKFPILHYSDTQTHDGTYTAERSYLIRPSVWKTQTGISFDLRLNVSTAVDVDPLCRSRNRIYSADVEWRAPVNKPLATVRKERPFPKRTALDAVLDEADITADSSIYTHLKEIALSSHSAWAAIYVTPHLTTPDGKRGWSQTFYASTEPDGREGLGDFSKGLTEYSGGRGSSDWLTWTFLDPATRKTFEVKYRTPRDPGDFRAYSVPDLKAIPPETEILRILVPSVTEDDLACLASLTKLRKIEFETDSLTEGAVKKLAALPRLKSVEIDTKDPMKTECFEILAALSLEDLTLHRGSGLNDAAIDALSRSSGLRKLTLNAHYGSVTDNGLAHLARLSQLEDLELWVFRGATNKGLESLAALKSLKRLLVAYMEGVTDPGLKPICELPALEILSIIQLDVTDEGLLPLGNSRNLKYLYLTQCKKLTREGMKALKARLPDGLESMEGYWTD